jgi:hypothetical protein
MKKTNFRFDDETNEVFFESKLQDRKFCVWIDVEIYNNLLPDEIEDICKVNHTSFSIISIRNKID